jgi:hypothetical protein
MPMLALVATSTGAQHEGALQRSHQALGQRHGVTLVADAFGQDGELVTAQPRQHVVGAQLFLHTARHLHQQLVAHVVAQAVVDELEAVEVDEHHRPHMAGVGLRAATAPARHSRKRRRLGRPVRLS